MAAPIVFTNDEIILGALIESCDIDTKIQIQIINAVPPPVNINIGGPFVLDEFIQYILAIRPIYIQRAQKELTLPFIVSSLFQIINFAMVNGHIIVVANNITTNTLLIQMSTINIINSIIFDAISKSLPNYTRDIHSLLQSILLEDDIDDNLKWENDSLITILDNIWNKIPNIIIEEEKIRIICNIIYELYIKNIQLRNAIEYENAIRYNAAVANYALIVPNMFPQNINIPQIGPNSLLADYNNWKLQIQRLNPSNAANQFLNEIKNNIDIRSIFS